MCRQSETLARYPLDLVEEIGHGGMAAVYEAMDTAVVLFEQSLRERKSEVYSQTWKEMMQRPTNRAGIRGFGKAQQRFASRRRQRIGRDCLARDEVVYELEYDRGRRQRNEGAENYAHQAG